MQKSTMAWSEWLAIEPHKYQRDTERHAGPLLKKFQKEGIVAERLWDDVSAVRHLNGRFTKMNGHTRTLLAERDLIPHPDSLEVKIFTAISDKQDLKIFQTFDNPESSKNASDLVHGAFRSENYNPKSGYFLRGNGKTALAHASGMIRGHRYVPADMNAFDLVREWLPQIKSHVDGFLAEADRHRVSAGIVAAALITTLKHGDDVKDFWDYYFSGNKDEAANYAPMALASHHALRAANNRKGGAINTVDILETAITCCERWLNGERINKVSQMNCETYLLPSWCLDKTRRERVRRVDTKKHQSAVEYA